MIIAFDSSALVKLTIPEPGADVVEDLWEDASRRVASTLAYSEVMAAFSSAYRGKRLPLRRLDAAREYFALKWRALDAIDVTESIAYLAGELVRNDAPLSGPDAVHLATALKISGDDSIFATWDKRLSRAARLAGLAVAP